MRTRLGSAISDGAIVGRSHRLHRPRGGFCARGYCQQCPLASGDLACETPMTEGRARRIDIRRPLGIIGGWMEPWFYERRFLRPSFARQWYLEVLRRLSSADPLPQRPAPPGGATQQMTVDLVVAGGGPAGVAAAAAAAASGLKVVVATRAGGGGTLPMDAATRARANEDIRFLDAHKGRLLERSIVAGRYSQEGVFVVETPAGPVQVRADRCVVATGAYDRPLLLAGAGLPGVIGLRAFQLLAAEGALEGRTIGAVGCSAELDRAASSAAASGLDLRWQVGPSDPFVLRIAGRGRARGLDLEDGRRLRADIVVIAATQPTYELQIHLGGTARFEGDPPVVRADVPPDANALVVGEAAGWVVPAGTADRAAAAVTAWLTGDMPVTEEPASKGPRVRDTPDAVVCVCEDVRRRDLDRAVRDGFADVDLLKRRSGATTGACQGKLCLCLIAEAFADRGLTPMLPTVRPPIRPLRIADLGAQR